MRAFVLILCAFGLLGAPPAPRRDRIRVPVWAQGDAPALEPAAVSASLQGEKVQVGRLLGPGDGLMLLVVSDMAGDLSLAQIAKRAVTENIRQLPPSVWVGVLGAQDGLGVHLDPTPDREAVAAVVQELPVSGRAGLLDTIQPAVAIADAVLAKAAVRTAILFITDSDVYNYREDFANPVINRSDQHDMSRRFPDALIRERISKLEAALSALETPVFIVHLAYSGDGLNEAYQAGLIRLAAATGGAAAFCRSQSEIPDAIARALESITSHYSLEIPLPEDAPKDLEVTLESEGRTLNYRSRFTN